MYAGRVKPAKENAQWSNLPTGKKTYTSPSGADGASRVRRYLPVQDILPADPS